VGRATLERLEVGGDTVCLQQVVQDLWDEELSAQVDSTEGWAGMGSRHSQCQVWYQSSWPTRHAPWC
jgi:hypothetical protein